MPLPWQHIQFICTLVKITVSGVAPQQQQVGGGLQQSQPLSQQSQAPSGSNPQQSAHEGPQTPIPLQQVQQACLAETLPL